MEHQCFWKIFIRFLLCCLSISAASVHSGFAAPESASVRMVIEGKATAVVVTADTPLPVAKHAADELVRHIEQATGVTLAVAVESAIPEGYSSRLFIGMTKAARAQGIVAEELKPEEFVMRSVGNDLFIVGEEDEGDPLSTSNSKCGTLFGVYELLERCLGVRWLWPGKLGTYIPPGKNVTLDAVDEKIAPRLAFREIVWGRVYAAAIQKSPLTEAEKILGFSPETLERYGHDLQDYMRRHRMGGMDRKPGTGHYFAGWWDRYGREHPEWFMMHENGKRGPSKISGTRQVPMCVSNTDLHRFIIDSWDGKSTIHLGEVDWLDACRCPACRAWDGSRPDPMPDFLVGKALLNFYLPICVSDRYARFWETIRRMAAERNPDALVTTFIYYGYFPAPAADIKLGKHVYGEFVPWGNWEHTDYFPMREEALEWLKQQWLGWQRTGMRLAYRPNYLHDGWVMPLVDVRQSAEFFKFAVEHGMEGSRFDSLTGQWAVHGPKLYVHFRLHAKPSLAVDDILDEYYGAFGPAEAEVREYFEYWEKYCMDNLNRINDIYCYTARWRNFPKKANVAFPPASFEPAMAILQRAKRAAQNDSRPEYAARVEFLQNGLEHSRLAGRLAALFDCERAIPEKSLFFDQAVEALRELVAFRRAHEEPYISDYLYGASDRENSTWNLQPLFERLKDGKSAED